jgi:hypothetical protein
MEGKKNEKQKGGSGNQNVRTERVTKNFCKKEVVFLLFFLFSFFLSFFFFVFASFEAAKGKNDGEKGMVKEKKKIGGEYRKRSQKPFWV